MSLPRTALRVAAVLFLLISAVNPSQAQEASPVLNAIVGINVVNVRTGTALLDHPVVIEDGRIQTVDATASGHATPFAPPKSTPYSRSVASMTAPTP